jgi:translation initiation factor eIF-2B subunit delta
MDAQGQEIIDAIRGDTRSGAAQLAGDALGRVRHWLATNAVTTQQLDQLLEALSQARPSMVPLANAIERCRQALGSGDPEAPTPERALAVVDSVLEQLASANQHVAEHAARLVPDHATVFTHSRSSQVVALFRLLVQQGRAFSVICTQGSPGNEGFTLARELDELGVPVTVITDAQMGLFVPKADLVVTGCDTWLADGHFLNKSGTYPLALVAKDLGQPFWVLADSFKESTDTLESVSLEEMPGDELGAPTGSYITPRNIYFETVPVRLITGRISEQGVSWSPAVPGP